MVKRRSFHRRAKAKNAAPKRRGPAKRDDRFHQTGYLIISDVIDFSRLDDDQQQKHAVRELWRYLAIAPLVRDALFNGTGDGVIVALPEDSRAVKTAGESIYRTVIEFARDWIAHMRAAKPAVELRVAVHLGKFYEVDVGRRGRQLMGTSLNRCTRLVGLGDAGKVTVSEQFYETWRETDATIANTFQPPGSEAPLGALVKHDEHLRFRYYWPDRKEGDPLPPKVESFEIVRENLLSEFDAIEEYLVSSLRDLPTGASLTSDQVGARISLWGAWRTTHGRVLRSTEIRFHRQKRGIGPSRITYSIEGDGEGPPGRAFCTREPFVLSELPAHSDDPDQYFSSLKTTGLKSESLAKFNHHSRSFLAVPFGLTETNPDGIICIDCESPLPGITREQLMEIGHDIADFFGVVIAALWRLRGES